MDDLDFVADSLIAEAEAGPIALAADLHTTIMDITADARQLCPRSGMNHVHTADTIYDSPVGGGDYDIDTFAVESGPTTWYAPFVERGTAVAAPHPFMEPAADMHTPHLGEALSQRILFPR